MAGHEVILRDIDQEIVDDGLAAIGETLDQGIELGKVTQADAEATLDRLEGETSLEDAVTGADLVVEAIPESLDLKHETFSEVESYVSRETILASNTSSLSLTEIVSVLDHPERAIGLHFFNPAHIMELVEVVVAEQSSGETVEFAHEFVDGIGKTAIEAMDSPGFASSRLGAALGTEAMRMLETGVASARDIDTALELGYNHPVGPIELVDMVGLDVRLGVLEYLHQELDERFRPPQILKQKVRAGNLGKKTGEGFYVWEDGEIVGTSGTRGGD
jgi:3-hydroxybutyryl-CoA dehydrogenase